MTQEEKDLLLQDLCGRLPYNVRMLEIEPTNNIKLELYLSSITSQGTCCVSTNDGGIMCSSIDAFKPYLFPLSSMSEEQREEFLNIQSEERKILLDALIKYRYEKEDKIPIIPFPKQIDWLNKNHFDYRGLISMGLAIDCTNLNIY